MTVKMYGIRSCPDVRAALENFERNGADVDFLDFAEDIRNLKEFLHIRDSNPLFNEVKDRGGVGIPCFVFEDGRVSLDPDEVK